DVYKRQAPSSPRSSSTAPGARSTCPAARRPRCRRTEVAPDPTGRAAGWSGWSKRSSPIR
ncbi:hypothetical protein, partial [Streptomyces sp. wa1071]|uniref:hypothetical protein n=1 Tax=Streptomyces sp. wa1071 TaxID=1828217 RepID=UPI00211D46A2